MNVQKLVLPVVVVAAISTVGFTEGGVVGRNPEPSPQATAMGAPIGPDPHPGLCVPASKLDPEAAVMSAISDIAVRHLGYVTQGNPISPIPHLQRNLPLRRLNPDVDDSAGGIDTGVGWPAYTVPGSPINPIPHFQPTLFLTGLVLEIESILSVEADRSVEEILGALGASVDGRWFEAPSETCPSPEDLEAPLTFHSTTVNRGDGWAPRRADCN